MASASISNYSWHCYTTGANAYVYKYKKKQEKERERAAGSRYASLSPPACLPACLHEKEPKKERRARSGRGAAVGSGYATFGRVDEG